MSGYLTKQGETIKLWKKRWFNLDEDHIYYYKSKGVSIVLIIAFVN